MVSNKGSYFRWIAWFVILIALAAQSPALAGGWVVVTLDRLPEQVVAGQPYSVGMMARQHGQTAWQVDELHVEARQAETGELVAFTAKPDQPPGHYQAELVFPEPGRWEWGVKTGLHPALQPMPVLEVAANPQATGSGAEIPAQAPVRLPAIPAPVLGLFALLAFVAGVVLIARSRKRWVSLLAGAGLVILCGGLAFAFFSSASAEDRQLQPAPPAEAAAAAGQKLFLAKGCVVCHTHDRAIAGSEQYGVNAGPNLTSYRNDPDLLHQWLKDPRSVKAGTDMPDLGLKLVEIEALIHFINADPGSD